MHRLTHGADSRHSRVARARPSQIARVRLFIFLALLAPLFVALQAVIEDGLPRVELRIVPRDVMVQVPVDVVVERIVDRFLHVPVPTAMLHPWTRLPWDVSRLPRVWTGPVGASGTAASVIGPLPPSISGIAPAGSPLILGPDIIPPTGVLAPDLAPAPTDTGRDTLGDLPVGILLPEPAGAAAVPPSLPPSALVESGAVPSPSNQTTVDGRVTASSAPRDALAEDEVAPAAPPSQSLELPRPRGRFVAWAG
jgi:hypothetical protein